MCTASTSPPAATPPRHGRRHVAWRPRLRPDRARPCGGRRNARALRRGCDVAGAAYVALRSLSATAARRSCPRPPVAHRRRGPPATASLMAQVRGCSLPGPSPRAGASPLMKNSATIGGAGVVRWLSGRFHPGRAARPALSPDLVFGHLFLAFGAALLARDGAATPSRRRSRGERREGALYRKSWIAYISEGRDPRMVATAAETFGNRNCKLRISERSWRKL